MNIVVMNRPVITEKSMLNAKLLHAYTFMVNPLATKAQVAEAVEQAFNVTVIKVNMTSLAAKNKRVGKSRQIKMGEKRKKAVVTLKDGDKIALFDIEG
ncbi:MAG TPA: 50S ribosomal protein L23 [Candidatus Saccharimonadia bacterium]|nr:50S ribosomal protein L23 [Candidatus Saccharimonadia bacterium]